MSGAATPTTAEPPALDERDVEPRTPMKRLGSTRKLAAFSSKFFKHFILRFYLKKPTHQTSHRFETNYLIEKIYTAFGKYKFLNLILVAANIALIGKL